MFNNRYRGVAHGICATCTAGAACAAQTARPPAHGRRGLWTSHALARALRAIQLAGLTIARSALVTGLLSLQAHAGVIPETSRVIFPAGATEQSLQVYDVNPYPVLVQAWIDDGRIDAVPQESTAPIVTLPPIFRLAAGDQTSLRMINSGAALPADRESLFWLNLYEIPATLKDQQTDAQAVTVTMRTQIKVFVRPAKLPYGSGELPKRLAFSLASESGKLVLKVENPTPYYATFSAILLRSGSASQQKTPDMVAPLSSAMIEFEQLDAGPSDPAELLFSLIDDDGNPVIEKVKVAIAP